MNQLQQGEITVVAGLILGCVFWSLCMIRHRDCDAKELAYFVGEVVGFVTGIFTVLSFRDVMKVSVQSGIVCGIAGTIIMLATLTDIIKRMRAVIRKKIEPKRIDQPTTV